MVDSFSDDFEGGTLGATVNSDDGIYYLDGIYVTGRSGLGFGDAGGSDGADYYGSPGVAVEGSASVDVLMTPGDFNPASGAYNNGIGRLRARDQGGDPSAFPPEYLIVGVAYDGSAHHWRYEFGADVHGTGVVVPYDEWQTIRFDWDATTLTFGVLDAGGASLWSESHTFGTIAGLEGHRPAGIRANPILTNAGRANVIIDNLVFSTATTPPPVAEPVTRMFPRDDALGLGSAPRLFPTPRGIRIVGGQD